MGKECTHEGRNGLDDEEEEAVGDWHREAFRDLGRRRLGFGLRSHIIVHVFDSVQMVPDSTGQCRRWFVELEGVVARVHGIVDSKLKLRSFDPLLQVSGDVHSNGLC